MTARIFKSLKNNGISKGLTMPHLGYAALVVFSASWACIGWAATEATSFQCPGGEWVVNPGTPDCPTQVESVRAGDLLTDTTTNVQSDLHQTGGTGYWCIYPAANADPTWDQLVAGNDGTGAACVDSGNGSASSTTFSGSATGLTAATEYNIAQGVLRNGKRSQVEVSAMAFTTLAGTAPGGTDLTNTCYVVDSVNGNDSNNGLTVATAWKTIAKVNSSVSSVGADICLMDDSEWNEQLVIDWGGSSSDMANVRAVYVDTGDSNKLVAYDTGTGTGRGARPKIGGDLTPACIAAANCKGSADYYFTGMTVSSGYVGQVEIASNYVRVAGLYIGYTAAIGIRAAGLGNGPSFSGTRHHFIIEDNVLEFNGKQQILAMNGAQNFVIRRNNLSNGGQCFVEGAKNGLSSQAARAPLCDGGAWGTSLAVIRSYDAQGLVENNDVHDTPQEGINMNQGTSHVIVRGNRIGNTHSTSGYCDMCTDVVWESNILWGVFGGVGDYTVGGSFGGGFGANVERNDYGSVVNNIIRNCITVDSGQAALVANTFTANGNPYAAGKSTNWHQYGNTHVSADAYNVRLVRTQAANDIRSTLFITDDISASATCSFSSVESLTLGDDYNYWSPTPSNATCVGANDESGTVTLATTETDWDSADYATNLPTIDDFRLQAGSAGIGAGDPALETEDLPNSLDYTDFGTWIWDYTEYPWAIDTLAKKQNWSKKLYYDFEGTARDATTPDIGALEYAP